MREEISSKLQELAEATSRKVYAKLELEEAQIQFKHAIQLCDKLSDELIKLQNQLEKKENSVTIESNITKELE